MSSALASMTGFGRAEALAGDTRLVWEVRSVNGRGLDVKTRLPPGYDALEPPVRAEVHARFKRGSMQLALQVRREGEGGRAVVDTAALDALVELGFRYVTAGKVAPPRFDGLLQVRGVMVSSEEASTGAAVEALGPVALEALAAALDSLAANRGREGAALAAALTALLDVIAGAVEQARALAEAQPEAVRRKIEARLAAIAPELSLDPQRLAQEAAFAATRADVREELDRLDAHVAEARGLLAQGAQIGRRLEFLAQEFAREANTLSAKAQDLALTRLALDLKTAVDQLKEQAANVE